MTHYVIVTAGGIFWCGRQAWSTDPHEALRFPSMTEATVEAMTACPVTDWHAEPCPEKRTA